MADLTLLKRQRGAIEHRITSFATFINKYRDRNLTDTENIEIDLRIVEAQEAFAEFKTVQTQIEDEVEQAEFETQLDYRTMVEDDFFSCLSIAKEINRQDVESLPPSQNGSVITARTVNAGGNEQTLRLPTIELPKFDGKYEHWLEFRDTFESLVNSNTVISKMQKYHYLRAALTGSASQILQSIEFSEAGYDIAYSTLGARFDNNKLLVHHHVRNIFELPEVKKASSISIRYLCDNTRKHLRHLKQLGEPTDAWDTLILYVLTNKLDQNSVKEWDSKSSSSLDDMFQFLDSKANLLETFEAKSETLIKRNKPMYNASERKAFIATKPGPSCHNCKKPHLIYKCFSFAKLKVPERIARATELGLCLNCLMRGHATAECTKEGCRKCAARHSSLLHKEESGQPPQEQNTSCHATYSDVGECNSVVLLATAQIVVIGQMGERVPARALLDCGSQVSFITERLVDKLKIPKIKSDVSIVGITNSHSQSMEKCNIEFISRIGTYHTRLCCHVLPEITGNLPHTDLARSGVRIPHNIVLADPNFNKSDEVDILIGAALFWSLLKNNTLNLAGSNVTLHETMLGWVLSGPFYPKSAKVVSNYSKVEFQLEKFWNVESMESERLSTPQEEVCEELFKASTSRDSSNKFVVRLPINQSVDVLGDSREFAIKRFQSLERKLQANPEFKKLYLEFMLDYETSGHMTRLHKVPNGKCYYVPHHGVINQTSVSTKLRVVFDGSAKSSSGVSINDIQLTGPILQSDLLVLLLRFRIHTYVVCADIQQMYRQIWIDPEQRGLQLILWRPSPSDSLETYCLNTVTYGYTSAPYLALRCLKQTGLDSIDSHPEAAQAILRDFYVDDFLSGFNSIEEAIRVCADVSEILARSGFNLRKWISNNTHILSFIKQEVARSDHLAFGDSSNSKTLGIYWSGCRDSLRYKIREPSTQYVTKRVMLSEIAQIFDPLGLMSPCVIRAKIMLQQLWLEKLSWDDHVPCALLNDWKLFRSTLVDLNDIEIPRHVVCSDAVRIEMHGFADASQQAYGACVYLRSISESGRISVHLLCSKTRVAPIKTLTIPRLELCAALVLAELSNTVRLALRLKLDTCIHWSDSTIVLHWLQINPNQLQVFVANRVSKILSLTEGRSWRHVRTGDNPADLLSRGECPSGLKLSRLWWHGPNWLSNPEQEWPLSIPITKGEIPELRLHSQVAVAVDVSIFPFSKFSNFSRMVRTMAYCKRFLDNCRKPLETRFKSNLTHVEMQDAEFRLAKLSQAETFSAEIKCLTNNPEKNVSGALIKLNPFLDKRGVIRVGGRLMHSTYCFDKKHPIVLSSKHVFTRLKMEHEHKILLHASPQLLLANIRENYWPISGKSLARQVVFKCIPCFRAKPRVPEMLMGSLPADRVSVTFPFSIVGVDYAGPFEIKTKKGRGAQVIKGYVCIFVCFATKAIHLELVTDLTTNSFIATLRRFASRRGKPTKIYSDNGRNFVGANAQLRELSAFLINNKNDIETAISLEEIEWHFIPPQSPHFGGLWEAGVRSTKYHMIRVMGKNKYTYEDFNSVLVQIECILNSRPLTPLSSDPSDLDVLTPGHFLIGRRMTAVPNPMVTHLAENKMSHYQQLQNVQQHFWQRWSKEYVSELQERHKWYKSSANVLTPGTLVLVKDNNAPVMQWCLGRVLQVFPGKDNLSRVAVIKTATTELRRSVAKLCPLPID